MNGVIKCIVNESSDASLLLLNIKVERDEWYLPYYRVRSLALQPLSAGNSTEFSQGNNIRTVQHRAMNLTSLDSLGSWELIYVYFKPKDPVET